MLIVMKANASEEQVRSVCQKIESFGFRAHSIPGAQRTAIGITGNEGEIDTGTFDEMQGVQEVIRVSKPYKHAVCRRISSKSSTVPPPSPLPRISSRAATQPRKAAESATNRAQAHAASVLPLYITLH